MILFPEDSTFSDFRKKERITAYTTTASEYESSTRLTPDETYYWHVRARNPEGDYSAYSSRWSFYVDHKDDWLFSTGPSGGVVIYDDENITEMQDFYINYLGMTSVDFKTLPGDYRYIEIAPADASSDAIFNSIYRPTFNQTTSTDIGTGQANCDSLWVTDGAINIAESFSCSYDGKTYSDWFLPSLDTMELACYLLNSFPVDNIDESVYWTSSYEALPVVGAYTIAFKAISVSGYSYSLGDILLAPETGPPSGEPNIAVLTGRMF